MQCTFIELPEFELISISGDDNKHFLQGQVSCDTEQLHAQQSLSGAICNLKGRVITDFRLVEYQQNCFLQVSPEMANPVKAVLDKYIVFAKAESNIASDRFNCFGLIGNDAHHLLETVFGSYPAHDNAVEAHAGYLIIKIPGLIPRFELWQDLAHDLDSTEESTDAINEMREHSNAGSEALWTLEDIRSGIAHVSVSMSARLLPEALNYDLCGVINFTKGCYTGQEIVARMYYRGTAKKRLYHAYFSGDLEEVLSINHLFEGKPATEEIVQFETTENAGLHLLVILPAEAVAQNTEFYLNNNSKNKVELLPLPYCAQE
jgi:folate-binding protein YgfZ